MAISLFVIGGLGFRLTPPGTVSVALTCIWTTAYAVSAGPIGMSGRAFDFESLEINVRGPSRPSLTRLDVRSRDGDTAIESKDRWYCCFGNVLVRSHLQLYGSCHAVPSASQLGNQDR